MLIEYHMDLTFLIKICFSNLFSKNSETGNIVIARALTLLRQLKEKKHCISIYFFLLYVHETPLLEKCARLCSEFQNKT